MINNVSNNGNGNGGTNPISAANRNTNVNPVGNNGNGNDNGGTNVFFPVKPPRDRVEISQAAVQMAQNGGSSSSVESNPKLDSIQNNISSGFYNSPEVLRTVARKMIDDNA
jgi:hypothetical protein